MTSLFRTVWKYETTFIRWWFGFGFGSHWLIDYSPSSQKGATNENITIRPKLIARPNVFAKAQPCGNLNSVEENKKQTTSNVHGWRKKTELRKWAFELRVYWGGTVSGFYILIQPIQHNSNSSRDRSRIEAKFIILSSRLYLAWIIFVEDHQNQQYRFLYKVIAT